MSDKNADGFMMIEGLPESVGKCECFCCELNKLQNEDSEKEIWNRAIEEAAKVCDINSAENVRKLKK